MTGHDPHRARRLYYLIFAALMVLTAATVGAAYLDLGRLNTVVALGIAVLKATFVILFFMHVWDSTRLTRIVVVSGFLWLAILFALTFNDYLSRGWLG
jgi:cytochrome c oxidase subunit 4